MSDVSIDHALDVLLVVAKSLALLHDKRRPADQIKGGEQAADAIAVRFFDVAEAQAHFKELCANPRAPINRRLLTAGLNFGSGEIRELVSGEEPAS